MMQVGGDPVPGGQGEHEPSVQAPRHRERDVLDAGPWLLEPGALEPGLQATGLPGILLPIDQQAQPIFKRQFRDGRRGICSSSPITMP